MARRDRPIATSPPARAAALRATPGARPLAWEGFFQSLGQGLGETYLVAFALWLGSGPLVLGLVATLPTASTALAQAVARRARGGTTAARRFLARTWTLQGLGYAAIGLCAFAPPALRAPALCTLALLTWGSFGIAVPAWTALVADAIPGERRGAFFGLRGAAQQAGVLVAIVGGAVLLHGSTADGRARTGFLALFLAAGVFRASGAILLAWAPEESRPRPAAPLAAGFREIGRSRKLRHLATYLWLLHFATAMSTPFFLPYMLDGLHLPYATVGLLLAVPALVKATTLRTWGSVADRVGPGPLLRTMGWLIVPVAALWLVSGSPWWILVAQIYSGIVWGGFELAQAASIVQVTRGREAPVAVFHLVDGMTILAGSACGALLVDAWGAPGAPAYLAAIGASSVLRALPAALVLWRVRGVGRPGWSLRDLPLRAWAIRPTRGVSLRPWGTLGPGTEGEGPDDRGERAPAAGDVPRPSEEPATAGSPGQAGTRRRGAREGPREPGPGGTGRG
jgi:predicted MFS family arabinose efflux permease